MLIATGLFLTLLVALLLIFPPLSVQEAELRLYDLMLSGRVTQPKTGVPLIVAIDDESLEEYGQWPWPRYRLARLVDRLGELGADVVAIDILMPEPDRTSPDVIMMERRRDMGIAPSTHFSSVPRDTGSQRLAQSLEERKSILGYLFTFSASARSGTENVPAVPAGMVVASVAGNGAGWPVPAGMIRSIPALTEAAHAEGFTNAQHDIDGVLRRVPLLLHHNGTYYPSLALGAILLAHPDRSIRIIDDSHETTLVWANHRIPLDRGGNFFIDFREKGKPFPYVSAREVLGGNLKTGSLRGKIAVVGVLAKGLGDIHLVPDGRPINGLEVHATIMDDILSGTYISHPGWARGAELFAVIFLGVLCSWFLSRVGLTLSLFIVATATGGSYLAGRQLLLSKGVYISPLLPMLTPVVIMTVLSLLRYGIEARKVRQRNRDLIDAQDAIIISMSALAEARDKETGGHIFRTQRYVETIARHLSTLPGRNGLDKAGVKLITKSAPLHDIGKVGIPDHILNKPGPLTDEEFEVMKTHTLIGASALSTTIRRTGHPENLEFLHYARQITISHHEKWDGSGYPHGLKGTDIPLAGRIMALADVYDALISNRVYRGALPHEEATKIIVDDSGKRFDPQVVEAFLAKSSEFIRIAREFSDESHAFATH